jgi:C1A family cysteine protease
MSLVRRYGYIPDKHDITKDPRTHELFGVANLFGTAFSMKSAVKVVKDQFQTSRCVGFGIAQALRTRVKFTTGEDIDPSENAIYTFSRALDRQLRGKSAAEEPLTDGGCMPTLAVQGLMQFGTPSNADWPSDLDNINDEPDAMELAKASVYRVKGWYRILSSGAQRLAEVKQALMHGFPVAIGVQVDQAFEDYDGSKPIEPPDPNKILGGHETCLVSYDAHGNVEGANSYGTSWGQDGFYWATSDWLLAPTVGDIIAITGELVAPLAAEQGGAS